MKQIADDFGVSGASLHSWLRCLAGVGAGHVDDHVAGRLVALKVLRSELADTPGLTERLAREGLALARVDGTWVFEV